MFLTDVLPFEVDRSSIDEEKSSSRVRVRGISDWYHQRHRAKRARRLFEQASETFGSTETVELMPENLVVDSDLTLEGLCIVLYPQEEQGYIFSMIGGNPGSPVEFTPETIDDSTVSVINSRLRSAAQQ